MTEAGSTLPERGAGDTSPDDFSTHYDEPVPNSIVEADEYASPVLDADEILEATAGDLQFLTAEDMERLQEERKDAIERGSPLGEEIDDVKALEDSRN